MSGYRELPPPPELGAHLSCLWFDAVDEAGPARLVRVLPDACVDVVWHAGRPLTVAGPDTGPLLERLAPGSLVVGARFRPGRAPEVLGMPAADLRDRRPP